MKDRVLSQITVLKSRTTSFLPLFYDLTRVGQNFDLLQIIQPITMQYAANLCCDWLKDLAAVAVI